MRSRTRTLAKLCWPIIIVVVASVALLADLADARVGGSRSVGSRGAKTFQAPPATNTAPKTAAPMEKSMTQPGKSAAAQSAQPAAGASRFGDANRVLQASVPPPRAECRQDRAAQ